MNDNLFKPFGGKWADDNVIILYKERTINIDKPIFVYRNLHKKGYWYSIKQNNKVVAHCSQICMSDVTFICNKKQLEYSKKIGKKLVHTFIKGKLSPSCMGTTAKRNDLPVVVSYSEDSTTSFIGTLHKSLVFNIKGAMGLIISGKDIKCAYSY